MASAFDVVKHFLGSVGSDLYNSAEDIGTAHQQFRRHPTPITAYTDARTAVDSFFNTLGITSKEITRPALGALAKEGQNPSAIFSHESLSSPFGPAQTLATEVANAFLHHYGITNGEPNAVQRAILPPGVDTNLDRQQALQAQFAPSYTAAENIAFQEHPISRFAAEAAFDPLNYVGVVSDASKVAEAARAAKAAEGSRLAAAALPLTRGTELAANVIERFMALPFEAALKGGGAALRLTGLGAPTAEGQLNQIMRGLGRFRDEAMRANPNAPIDIERDYGAAPNPQQVVSEFLNQHAPATGAQAASPEDVVSQFVDAHKPGLTGIPDKPVFGQSTAASQPALFDVQHPPREGQTNFLNVLEPANPAAPTGGTVPVPGVTVQATLPGIEPPAPTGQQRMVFPGEGVNTPNPTLGAPPTAATVAEPASPEAGTQTGSAPNGKLPSGIPAHPPTYKPGDIPAGYALPNMMIEQAKHLAGIAGQTPEEFQRLLAQHPEQARDLIDSDLRHAQHMKVSLGKRFPTLEEDQTAIEQLLSASPDDPRFRYISPELRQALGKESSQPALLNDLGSRRFTAALLDIWNRLAGDQQLGFLPPWARRGINEETQKLDTSTPLTSEALAAFNRVRGLPGVQEAMSRLDKVDQRLTELAGKAGDLSTTSLPDYLAAARDELPAPEYEKLTNTLARDWGLGKVLGATPVTPETLREAGITGSVKDVANTVRWGRLFESAQKELEQQLGIDDGESGAIASNLGWLAKTYRRLNLITPHEVVANAVDMSIKSLLTGVPLNPAIEPEAAAALAGLDGVPGEVRGFTLRQAPGITPEFTAGKSTLRRFDNLKVLRPVAKLDELRAAADIWLDSKFRSLAWNAGFQQGLERAKPDFLSEAVDAAKGAGVEDTGTLKQAIDNLGDIFSPAQVRETVLGTSGDEALADRLATAWQRNVNQASVEGIHLADRVHYNFTDVRKGDQWAKHFLTYHFWATRNIPFWLDIAARDPELFHIYQQYEDIANQEAQERGDTTSRHGDLFRIGLGMTLGPRIFGPGRGYLSLDPSALLSIRDQLRDQSVDPTTTAVGRALETVSGKGFPLAPWIEVPLNVVGGVFGEQEPRSLVRYDPFIGDVTDRLTGHRLDPEMVLRAFELHAKQALHPDLVPPTVSGDAYRDYQINKKIREILYDAGYNPQDPMGAEAMADKHSPLYRAAADKVDNENITRFFANLISPTLVHSESNDEALSRQAAVPNKGVNLSPETRAAMVTERNPATLYWNLPQDQREAEIRAAQALMHQYNPIFWTLPSFMEQIYQRYPAYQSYEAWRGQQPRGANVSVDAYLGNSVTQQDLNQLAQAAQQAGMSRDAFAQWLVAQGVTDPNAITKSQLRYLLKALNDTNP